jgi:ribosomal protein S18 acetylase RimI-like enzyme
VVAQRQPLKYKVPNQRRIVEIKFIESIEESKSVFPIMKELRSHLSEAEYLELLLSAKANGYQLVGAYEGKNCLGLMGYRTLFDFVHGKHIYIDDLVVTASIRSQGIGAQLLSYAKEIAMSNGCSRLRLCTGNENENGKRFYEKNGWEQRAVVYKMKIS